MNCSFCKGDLAESTTSYVVNLKNCVIIIKNVPCTECTQCGETFLDDPVMEQIEKIVNALRTGITEVVIINYPDKVVYPLN